MFISLVNDVNGPDEVGYSHKLNPATAQHFASEGCLSSEQRTKTRCDKAASCLKNAPVEYGTKGVSFLAAPRPG